jgi:predicted RNase H-like HicB family nuclease
MNYTLLLTPDSEAGGYTVSVPALKGVVTEGETIDEAIANARDAISLWIESRRSHGWDVPEETEHSFAIIVNVDVPELAAANS